MVDADVLLDGFFQFFFYFRLRFSEDIYDDGLSGFRIVTDSVSSLPAAVLSFADVPLLLQRCDFWTVKKPFPLTTAAQNIHVFLPKLPLHKKHFFGWLKAANFSIVCGTVTLKSPPSRGTDAPRVHPRPRKRLSRCTLDCGFKTSESPALRGFVAERGQIRGTSLYLVLKSNGPHCSKNLPVKFGFSSKTVPANIVQKLPSQRCSKSFLIPPFNFSHKRPTFALTPESEYTLGLRRKIAHNGLRGEAGAFRMGVLSLSARTARSQTSPGRVSERQTLPLLGLGQVYFRSTQASRPRWVA